MTTKLTTQPAVLLTKDTIQQRIGELATQICCDYLEKGKSITLICVLKGGFLFCADLSRAISLAWHRLQKEEVQPLIEIEFLSARSYVGQTSTLANGGELRIELDTRNPIEGKNVIIVEDIIDTGLSMNQLCDRLSARKPTSLSICTLLSKPSRREAPVPIDYCGFEIEDKFVIGYGMDYDERYRELPYIGYLA